VLSQLLTIDPDCTTN